MVSRCHIWLGMRGLAGRRDQFHPTSPRRTPDVDPKDILFQGSEGSGEGELRSGSCPAGGNIEVMTECKSIQSKCGIFIKRYLEHLFLRVSTQ